jgi:hypothetical protein
MSLTSLIKLWYDCLSRLLAFQSSVGLGADIAGGSGSTLTLEKAGKERVEEGSEDNLGAIGDGKGHPENQDELEDVVEGCQEESSAHALTDKVRGV